jgi:hypothetical protein
MQETPSKLMCDHFVDAQNISRIGRDAIINFSDSTEDMELFEKMRARARPLWRRLGSRIKSLLLGPDALGYGVREWISRRRREAERQRRDGL